MSDSFSKISLCLLLILFNSVIFASLEDEDKNDKKDDPIKQGNFSLPGSQQPGPLVSFGEHIIAKGKVQLYLQADDFAGKNKHLVDALPGILYGIADNFSVFLSFPMAIDFRYGNNHSSGIEDIFLSFEYAYYNTKSKHSVSQGTILGTVFFPSGIITKEPSTGNGAVSFFIGTTFNKTYTEWFFFGSPGALFPTTNGGTRIGNEYDYQLGFGRNIKSVPDKYIFAWMVEMDGAYFERDRINGILNPNSGGNLVYVTPSIWYSTKKLIFQVGVGGVLTQHWLGNQTPEKYLITANLGCSLT